MNTPRLVLSLILLFVLFPLALEARKSPQSSSFPLTFEENAGQAAPNYAFLTRDDGVRLMYFTNGLDLVFHGSERPGNVLRLMLTDTETQVSPSPKGLQGSSNYFVGADRSRWITGIRNYSRIEYKEIYPGISLSFYGNGKHLEHDFEISPGGIPSRIGFSFSGARKLELSRSGDLHVLLADDASVSFRKPIAYQLRPDGRRDEVRADFVLRKNGKVQFRVGQYDSTRALIIDPVFVFSTYLAGTHSDNASAVTTDKGGNIYITGNTSSTDFPTANAEQPQMGGCDPYAGCQNTFVTKLDPTGHSLIYSTYIGGVKQDRGAAIVVDSSGNAIVGGVSLSGDNFPQAGQIVSPSCQINYYCYFLASLKPDGSGLNYSGIIGGSEGFYTNGNDGRIAVDKDGNAYLTGVTTDPNFQITPGTLTTTVPGYPYDTMFVLKVDSTGKLIYSTIVPGNAPQDPAPYTNLFMPAGISVDASGNATIAGTAGQGLPTTAGTVQAAFPNDTSSTNSTAGFVLQLNSSASLINFATYLPGTDTAGGMTVDGSGNFYVTGGTSEANLPVSGNAYQKKLAPGSSCTCNAGYVIKLNPELSSILAASYLSGTPAPGNEGTSFTAIALDSQSNVFLGGMTGSTDFPLVDPFTALWEYTSSAWEMVLAEMSPDLSALKFGSFLSSTQNTFPGSTFAGIATDPSDHLIVVGTTVATDFPTTASSYQPKAPPSDSPYTSYVHSFVSKIDMASAAPSVCFDAWNLDLGAVAAKTSSNKMLNLRNCGNATLNLTKIDSSDPTVSASQSCGALLPGDACPITVSFAPVDGSSVIGGLTFFDNAAIPTQAVGFSGQGQAPKIAPGSNPLLFGHFLIGTRSPVTTLDIWNQGNASLTISSVTVTGSDFSLINNGCTSVQPVYSVCTVNLIYTPSASGTNTGSLSIASNDPVTPVLVVTLTGVGDSSYAIPTITSVTPNTVPIKSAATIQIAGSNFYPSSTVLVNGAAQNTVFVSNGTLQATIDASLLADLGEVLVSVSNPNPGGGTSPSLPLAPYRSIFLSATRLVYEPNSGTLYAAIPASAPTNQNTVVPINPSNGSVGTPIPVGNNPKDLAVSGDGKYLYVGLDGDHALQRINVQTQMVDRTFPLPVDPSFGNLTVKSIAVIPGSPTSVVVVLFRPASPAEDGAALYNDLGLVKFLPNDYTNSNLAIDSITFASDPSIAFGLPSSIVNGVTFFTELGVSSSGLSYSGQPNYIYPSPQTGSLVVSDGNLLYTSSGQVWDPGTQHLLGSYSFPSSTWSTPVSLIPDSSTARTFFLDQTNSSASVGNTYYSVSPNVDAFKATDYSYLGSLSFPTIPPNVGDLARWGTDGFAIRIYDYTDFDHSGDQIAILRSSLAGQRVQNPVPTIASLNPNSAVVGASDFALTVSGSNFIRNSTILWNGTPLSTQYVSSTLLRATVDSSEIASTGSAQIAVTNPPPGGGTSSTVAFDVLAAAPIVSLSSASLDFGNIGEQLPSAPKSLTVTNTGSAPLTISSIATTGDYSQTNNCGVTLLANAQCVVNVVFAPASSGTRTGNLTFNDNAANSPQVVGLSGTGIPPLAVQPAAGASTSATVSAGGTAVFNLSLASISGFSGTATLSCSGAPLNSRCTVSPTAITLPSGGSAAFSVSIATSGNSANLLHGTRNFAMFLILISLVSVPIGGSRRKSVTKILFLCTVASMLGMAACGGGGSSTPQPSPSSTTTPAGTYAVTVTATIGTQSANQQLTLVVK